MNRLLTIILLFIFSEIVAQNDLGGIGQWRGHFNNHSIRNVIKGDYLYAASPYQIIKFENKNPINWFDKSTGLNDIGIEHIAWDKNQEQLIITYSNSNIDIVNGDEIFNINARSYYDQFIDVLGTGIVWPNHDAISSRNHFLIDLADFTIAWLIVQYESKLG
jgi:hypothetical protein